jgi:murein DD-endopeptidase MepM/ murein hydrolase activator NlpD
MFCQDGAVSPKRSFTAATLLTLALAGCGGGPAAPSVDPSWVATPDVNASTGGAVASVSPSVTRSANASTTSATKKPPAAEDPTTLVAGATPYAFPVAASDASWHRTHSKYPATDIFAACGKPVLAAANGVVLEVSRKDTYVKGRPDGPTNGGLSVSILGADGVRYYGSHLSKIQPGIGAGARVRAGDQIGLLGHTGNANNVCHLHFGISPECAGTGDWKVRRGVVWPYTYLDSWRKKGNKSPVPAVVAWKKAHSCKA